MYNNRNLVSVIIPTYKRPVELARAINSVMQQTYEDIEVLVVNDDIDSEKEIREIINEFQDNRIKYYNNERVKGGNGARNTGILNAYGKYITFLDDDDEFTVTRLNELVNFACQNNAEAVLTNYYYVQNGSELKKKSQCYDITLKNYFDGKVSLGSGSNVFLRKDIVDSLGLWNESLARHQDLEFIVRLLAMTRVHYLDQRLLKIYGHNGNPDPFLLEKTKVDYFKSIAPYTVNVPKNILNKYYAMHYRGLALLFGDFGYINKMFYYGKVSIRHKILTPEKYVRFFLCLIHKYTGFNVKLLWHKLTQKKIYD